ncbi:hypothetical protein SATMO3_26430 [Sporomusa aerivorans]
MARQPLAVLSLAEILGNVSEACRRGSMERTSFYEWSGSAAFQFKSTYSEHAGKRRLDCLILKLGGIYSRDGELCLRPIGVIAVIRQGEDGGNGDFIGRRGC